MNNEWIPIEDLKYPIADDDWLLVRDLSGALRRVHLTATVRRLMYRLSGPYNPRGNDIYIDAHTSDGYARIGRVVAIWRPTPPPIPGTNE